MGQTTTGQTLFDKLWQQHKVMELENGEDLIFIDRIFLHERTGTLALEALEERGLPVRRPRHAFCVMDHIIDTFPGRGDATRFPGGTQFIVRTRQAAARMGLRTFDIGDPDQGISHLVSAEQGIALPGLSLVCPDSHTCTLGALGTLAWGIGTSEAEHALATSTLALARPPTMRIEWTGSLGAGVSAKDMALFLISRLEATGGRGAALEFCGPAIAELPVEGRMTLCNLGVEFSAFTALIAPDDKTIDYVQGRPLAPDGKLWEQAREHWRTLHSDPDACFDHEHCLDAAQVQPMVSWGTSPEQSLPVVGRIPAPEELAAEKQQLKYRRALDYMGLAPGSSLQGVPVDAAFIGSCTNARLSDLREAARVLQGRRVARGVTAICVPGSSRVKAAAESEGLDRVFREAGFQWREAGCSLCFYAGGEGFGEGRRVISTTNRNFEGRQGPSVRTHLASPATVAASAVRGAIELAEAL